MAAGRCDLDRFARWKSPAHCRLSSTDQFAALSCLLIAGEKLAQPCSAQTSSLQSIPTTGSALLRISASQDPSAVGRERVAVGAQGPSPSQ